MSELERGQELAAAMKALTTVDRQLVTATGELNFQMNLKRRSELTKQELDEYPDDVTVYRTVGRMFVRDDLASMKKEVAAVAETAANEQAKLKKSVEALQVRRAEADKNLQELTKTM